MKKNLFFKTMYLITLIIFSVYVLLDTFVIAKSEVTNITYASLYENTSNTTNTITTSNSTSTESTSDYTVTDTTYSDENITITITTMREYDTEIYIADVQISNIAYLKTAFANNTYGRNIKQTTSAMASSNNAILAINGDYYGFRNYGYVLRNGVIYRTTKKSSDDDEDLVINEDGTFSIINESTSDINELLDDGALQILSFGPSLINNGSISVTTTEEVSQSKSSNPRTAIGIISPLHYVFVVSDGRTSASNGLSLYELAEIMDDLGCTTAYNLDGGGSSTMWFNGKVVNNPTDGSTSGERSVSDIVYIGY